MTSTKTGKVTLFPKSGSKNKLKTNGRLRHTPIKKRERKSLNLLLRVFLNKLLVIHLIIKNISIPKLANKRINKVNNLPTEKVTLPSLIPNKLITYPNPPKLIR